MLSQSNLALDFYGNAAVDSTTVKFAGTKSFAFAGSGDYLKTSLTESIKILTDQFTVECWARRVPDTGVSSGIFQISSNAPGNQTTAGMGVFTRDPVVWNSVWAFEVNGTNNLTATAVPSDNVPTAAIVGVAVTLSFTNSKTFVCTLDGDVDLI